MTEPSGDAERNYPGNNASQGNIPSAGVPSENKDESKKHIPHNYAYNPNDEADRLVREFLEWIRGQNISFDQWIIAVFTFVLAAVAIGQFCLVWQNSRTSTTQIQNIIDAANSIKGSASSFSGSAASINGGIGNAVSKLQGQVEQTAQLATKADQANKIAQQAIDSQIRPWIDASAGELPPSVSPRK